MGGVSAAASVVDGGGVSAAASVVDGGGERGQLAAAFAAVRARLGLVALLLGLAGLAWWFTAGRMARPAPLGPSRFRPTRR
jgi:hypothetical protein